MLKAKISPERPTAPSGGFAGSCHCLQVQYKCTELPQKIVNCYCIECRKQSGGPYMSYVKVNKENFTWSIEDARYRGKRKVIVDGPTTTRKHCTSCRSPLCREDRCLPGEIQVVRTSIDDPGPDDACWSNVETIAVNVDGAPKWVGAPREGEDGKKVFPRMETEYFGKMMEFNKKRHNDSKQKSALLGFGAKYKSKRF